ncbi:hypothetical protein Dimus_016673 [Dionaea muscipula]
MGNSLLVRLSQATTMACIPHALGDSHSPGSVARDQARDLEDDRGKVAILVLVSEVMILFVYLFSSIC